MTTPGRAAFGLATALALARVAGGCAGERPGSTWRDDLPPPPVVHEDAGPQPFDAPADVPPSPLEGVLGPNVTQAEAPPALSGGTLLATRDGRYAVAADPDHDAVHVVDLTAGAVATLALQRGDEPGRVAEDAAGRVHVALRRGGALVTFDPSTRAVIARRDVCAAPRGVAFDARLDAVHVACAGGELVTLPAAGGAATRTLRLDADLRDVVVDGERLHVTRFRAAEVLTLDARGQVAGRATPPAATTISMADGGTLTSEAAVAWRAAPAPRGGAVLLHQRASASPVELRPGGYGTEGRCRTGVVHTAVTMMTPGSEPVASPPLAAVVLAVDLAVSPDGAEVAMAAPGNALLSATLQVVRIGLTEAAGAGSASTPCGVHARGTERPVQGQAVAVAYTPSGELLAQTREPYAVVLVDQDRAFALPGPARPDTGHALFHANGGGMIACASCHPEGAEDGRVWNFSPIGPRRTQSLRGALLGTEPFHWDGDMSGFARLMTDVFTGRMSGGRLTEGRAEALGRWLDAQPALPARAPSDVSAVARGRAVFNDPAVGCAGCHAGPRLTNNQTVDVGTGAAFQVPALRGLGGRAPYMHDGCAATLRDRFTSAACGGGDAHGHTSQLAPGALDDLVAYLESL